jgi:hypothetical protein
VTAAATLLGFIALLQPQDQERARELEKQRWLQERIAQPEFEGESFFDYGLWFRPQYFAWEDGAGQNRSQASYDLRPWIDYRVGGHTIYARLLARYVDWAPGDSPDGDDEDSDFDVDLAFWQYDFGETTELGATRPVGFLRAGRIYYVLGSGLAFNGRGDGILAGWRFGPVRLTSFLAITPINTEDLDQARPNPDETRRIFYTLLIEGAFSTRHVPYLFGVVQRDRNKESPDDPFQDFTWDSEYWGGGVRGLLARGLTYLVEAIYGTGERIPDAPGAPAEDIKSWAAVAELGYALGGEYDLRLEAAFYAGSGDKDRAFIGNTILGNTPGTDDRAFTSFGFIPAGLVLNPLIANIKVHKLGLYGKLVKPQQVFDSGALDAGIELYYYSKHRDGPISDPFMDLTRRRIGWEIDLIVNWTLATDLAMTIRGGYFEPASNGGAPLVDDPRHFALIGVVYSY